MGIRQQFAVFIIRWVLNSVGIWVAVRLLGADSDPQAVNSVATFAVAGLVFSVVNTVLKPIVVILSLPAILLTLGLLYRRDC